MEMQLVIPFQLLIPTTTSVLGVMQKQWQTVAGVNYANWFSEGSSETNSNGAVVVEERGKVLTWFNPAIKANCRIVRLTDNAVFEIIGEPDNHGQRSQLMSFKVRRIKGGA